MNVHIAFLIIANHIKSNALEKKFYSGHIRSAIAIVSELFDIPFAFIQSYAP